MSIDLNEVNRIAKLSRLSFNETEKQKLQQELSAILDYVDQLKEVQEKVESNSFVDPIGVNLMREDVAEQLPDVEKFIAQAPDRQDKFIKVKSILE